MEYGAIKQNFIKYNCIHEVCKIYSKTKQKRIMA